MNKKVSAGIIIQNSNNQILGCHGTGRKFAKGTYDIPKGEIENGETPYQTIIRECFEETGIDLRYFKNLIELGEYKYLPLKNLYLFYLRMEIPYLNTLSCRSTFERHGIQVPEVNEYRWVNSNELEWFYNSLNPVLDKVLNKKEKLC